MNQKRKLPITSQFKQVKIHQTFIKPLGFNVKINLHQVKVSITVRDRFERHHKERPLALW